MTFQVSNVFYGGHWNLVNSIIFGGNSSALNVSGSILEGNNFTVYTNGASLLAGKDITIEGSLIAPFGSFGGNIADESGQSLNLSFGGSGGSGSDTYAPCSGAGGNTTVPGGASVSPTSGASCLVRVDNYNGISGSVGNIPTLTNSNILSWFVAGIQNYLAGAGGGSTDGGPYYFTCGADGTDGIYLQGGSITVGSTGFLNTTGSSETGQGSGPEMLRDIGSGGQHIGGRRRGCSTSGLQGFADSNWKPILPGRHFFDRRICDRWEWRSRSGAYLPLHIASNHQCIPLSSNHAKRRGCMVSHRTHELRDCGHIQRVPAIDRDECIWNIGAQFTDVERRIHLEQRYKTAPAF